MIFVCVNDTDDLVWKIYNASLGRSMAIHDFISQTHFFVGFFFKIDSVC